MASKLLYGLQSRWFSKAQCKRLSGFRCACLRTIARIPHSFISHITKGEVLQTTKMAPLANTLLNQQLQYFDNVAREFTHPRRGLVFKHNGWALVGPGLRKQGRPRADLAQQIMNHVRAVSNDFVPAIIDRKHWRNIVIDYCDKLI